MTLSDIKGWNANQAKIKDLEDLLKGITKEFNNFDGPQLKQDIAKINIFILNLAQKEDLIKIQQELAKNK